jgi:DNA helicase-2/ATP-dependent DNA helicase PcrA
LAPHPFRLIQDAQMTFTPTKEQERILAHSAKRHGVIFAGPGTGKSATMVALVEQYASQDPPVRVRLLTFTRAATGELAKKVSEHPTLAAERPSTIHSFAISVLLKNPGAADYPHPLRLADEWEYDELVRPTLAKQVGVGLRDIDRLMLEMEANWQSLVPYKHVKVTPEMRARFVGAWQEHRSIYGYTMLSELPDLLRRALGDHPDLSGGLNHEILLVDEYQDLNACDIELLQRLAQRGGTVLAAGDDDQSIYSFRKADPAGIRRFTSDYTPSAEYPLSITQRCGKRIVQWARFVIEGDTTRPKGRSPLTAKPTAPEGEVALMAFADEEDEARGAAHLIKHLINDEGLVPGEILVLMRGDRYGLFSRPLKKELAALSIPTSDPDVVRRALAEDANRRRMAMLRLLTQPQDSLAWVTILNLTQGVGETFIESIYQQARKARKRFGETLLDGHKAGFPTSPKPARTKAAAAISAVQEWLGTVTVPRKTPSDGWGEWIVSLKPVDEVLPAFSAELAEIIGELDRVVEADVDLPRFLNQIAPLGKDIAQAKQAGVRFMSMAGSKGLTVEATILIGCERGLIPRPDQDLSEERRLLYVAMTRARRFLFCTWARRRRGPTARSGTPNVGDRRTVAPFLEHGPVESQDGDTFIAKRWPTS